MNISMEGVNIYKKGNGLIIKSEKPLYVLANRKDYDFKYSIEFNNHYINTMDIERFIIEKNGIVVISSVEYFRNKFFINISLLLDVALDNLTMIHLFRIVTETISTTSWKMGAINEDELCNELGNFYNTIFIACKSKSNVDLSFDISLFYEVKEIVNEILIKSLKSLKLNNSENSY